jgi:threonine/homoserine/homoserine lactone efflux protein
LFGGVLFSTILNPTVALWWATVGLVMLTEAVLVASFAGAAFWLLGHFTADLVWFSFVPYSMARGRTVIGTKGYKALLITCGCGLLIFGVYFIFKFALSAL